LYALLIQLTVRLIIAFVDVNKTYLILLPHGS